MLLNVTFLSVMPHTPPPTSYTKTDPSIRQFCYYASIWIFFDILSGLVAHQIWVRAVITEFSLLCCVSLLEAWSCFWYIPWFMNCEHSAQSACYPCDFQDSSHHDHFAKSNESEDSIWMAGNGEEEPHVSASRWVTLKNTSKFFPSPWVFPLCRYKNYLWLLLRENLQLLC